MMEFEPAQRPEMLGPLIVEGALSDIPIFGAKKANVSAIIESALAAPVTANDMVYDGGANGAPVPDLLTKTALAAEKMRSLRSYAKDINEAAAKVAPNVATGEEINGAEKAMADLKVSPDGPPSCRELHENLLTSLFVAKGLPREAQSLLDHIMLLRAREKYLFDAATNRNVVDDDPWLGFLWDWIAGMYSYMHMGEELKLTRSRR
jgi:WD repeat-containing protein mio